MFAAPESGNPVRGILPGLAALLLRPRPAVWGAVLLGLFLAGAGGIYRADLDLPAKVLSLLLLAGGLAALAAGRHLVARWRWRRALDAFARRELALRQRQLRDTRPLQTRV